MDIERLKELKRITEQLYQDSNVPLTYCDDVLELIDEAIARQSATSDEVAEAIKRFEKRNNKLKEVQDNGDAGCVDIETWEKYQGFIEDNNLAITALKEYKPKGD
jgi:phage baseplate assembly protein W